MLFKIKMSQRLVQSGSHTKQLNNYRSGINRMRSTKSKGKNKDINQYNQPVETRKKQIVTSRKWAVKPNVHIKARSCVYFLRTTLENNSEELLWQFYNIIREIEATFRVLKTDLNLRLIYHKKNENTMAH